MSILEDTVRTIVKEFMDNDELFTALDVSNRVKALLPHTRHREVRDVVRALFTTDIETQGWARSPINVTLSDGTPQQAWVYHPLSDAWDLDVKYDQQKRQQTAVDPAKVAAAAVASQTIGSLIQQKLTVQPAPAAPQSATVTVSATAPVPMPTAHDLWNQLFATQPSLFPTK